VWVLSGAIAPFQPSTFAITVAERIPASTYVRWDEVGHFGPLEKPELISQYVSSVVPTLS
jgi:pimeloyl-ACP methyl ester carboxylesterase